MVADGSNDNDNATPQGPRRFLMPALKIAVTLLGLYLVLSQISPEAILTAITQSNPLWLAAGAGLMILSLFVRAYRWQIVLKGVGATIRYARLVELYFVGSFFNAFLPSGIGGDVVRAAEAARDVDANVAAGTVVIDRLTGLMALFAMALAVLPFRPPDFPSQLLIIIIIVSLGGLLAGLLLVDGRFVEHLLSWAGRWFPGPLPARIAHAVAPIGQCSTSALLTALAISVVFNLMQIGWWYAMGRALSIQLSYSYYMLVVPIMSLALLVPSIGGLGVRESLAPFLFAGGGVPPEQAVALSLLVFGLERLASLVGAPIYLISTVRAARNNKAENDAIKRPAP